MTGPAPRGVGLSSNEVSALVAVRELREEGRRRFALLTTRTQAAGSAVVAALVAELGGDLCCPVFTVPSHTPSEVVNQIVEDTAAARVDVLLAVGGGSVIDAAKSVRAALSPDRSAHVALQSLAVRPRPQPEPTHLLVVPTTLSAAEFTPSVGVTDAAGAKHSARHASWAPDTVVIDARASVETPAATFLTTGARSIDHAVEAMHSPRATADHVTELLDGLTRLVAQLRQVRAAPDDLGLRHACHRAVWQIMSTVMTGLTFGASHGIGYALGGFYGVAHGHTSAVLLPAVTEWNSQSVPGRRSELVAALGEPGSDRPAHDVIRDLMRTLGLPTTLEEVGITSNQWPHVARLSMGMRWIDENPRRITAEADIVEILELAADSRSR